MHKRTLPALLVLLLSLFLLMLTPPALAASSRQTEGVVHAVLFFSPTCPHCEKVIQQDLPPLFRTYSPDAQIVYYPPPEEGSQAAMELALVFGGRLEVLFVNVATANGSALYGHAIDAFTVPQQRQGVPALFVGSRHLVGSREIPQELPGIIRDGLAAGGIPWPDLPGLADALAAVPTPQVPANHTPSPDLSGTAAPAGGTVAPTTTPVAAPPVGPAGRGMLERFLQDPAGNSVAVVALAIMLASLIVIGFRLGRPPEPVSFSGGKIWATPLLAVAGLAIAAYLTYVETSGAIAVCGPVGDCNTVQTSPYAYLFGVVPMGLVGLLGYLAILLAWAAAHRLADRAADWAHLALFAFTAFGTVFSAILTFLEPFVIGATCLWCVASALLMTALLWLSSSPGMIALARLTGESERPDESQQSE